MTRATSGLSFFNLLERVLGHGTSARHDYDGVNVKLNGVVYVRAHICHGKRFIDRYYLSSME